MQSPSESTSGAEDESADYSSSIWLKRIERARRLMPTWAYLWLSARILARNSDEWNWRNSDDKWNEWSTPPPDEALGMHAVWLVEAYLPSTIGALANGLRLLAWWDTRHGDKSIAEAIATGRSGRGGGWQNLPYLRRRSERRGFFPGGLERDLPDRVAIVTGQLHYLTPSLTVLVAGFRFDESVSEEANEALRRPYRTFHRMTGRTGSEIHDALTQRRDAMRQLESARIDACRAWLTRSVPGYFAAGGDASPHPATLLITTRRAVPFEREGDPSSGRDMGPAGGWMHTAGLEFALERWETGISGLRYAVRTSFDGVPVLAGRGSDIFADEDGLRRHGYEPTVWSLMARIEMAWSRLLALLMTDSILWDVRRRLGQLRDSLASASSLSSERQLLTVKAQLGTMSSDLASLTSEMLRWSDHPGWVLHDVPDIRAVDDSPTTKPSKPADDKSLRLRLLEAFVDHAREVREFEASTRGLLVATADIAAALENIRLQRSVRRITFLTLLIALLALGVTVVGVAHTVGILGGVPPSPSPLP